MLKFGLPHMEAEQEIDGLHFWNGDGAVSVLEADAGYNAMLLEYCVPGTPLGAEPEPLQDQVLAGLLRRLWRVPDPPHPFRPLAAMTEHWSQQARATIDRATDRGLVEEGLRLFHELPHNAPEHVLLATDLHAGNVLRVQREPWLVINPKPFVGDPAYDATQHLYNCKERLFANPDDTNTASGESARDGLRARATVDLRARGGRPLGVGRCADAGFPSRDRALAVDRLPAPSLQGGYEGWPSAYSRRAPCRALVAQARPPAKSRNKAA